MGESIMSDITKIRSIEQKRAQFAYNCALKGSKIEKKTAYKSYVKKIPMLIKTNGLGSTFAFIESKKGGEKEGKAYELIYEQTTNWLSQDNTPFNISVNSDLVKYIISLDSQTYKLITNEVLFLFKWIIRFADGLK
jgi:CRISPR-associated protein Cmr5